MLHAGVTCPELEKGSNTKYELTKRGYGVQVTVTCEDGYWFSANNFTLMLSCQDDGTWSGDMANCSS